MALFSELFRKKELTENEREQLAGYAARIKEVLKIPLTPQRSLGTEGYVSPDQVVGIFYRVPPMIDEERLVLKPLSSLESRGERLILTRDVCFPKDLVVRLKEGTGVRNALIDPHKPGPLIIPLENIRIVIAPIITNR